jgi:membrane fusion protein, multidrug efflux system
MRVKKVSIYLSVLVALVGCSRQEPPAPPRPQPVRTVEVRTGTLQERVDSLGTVHSRRAVQVVAQLPGTLVELPFSEGAQVEAGEVVARIAAPENAARLERARAEREKARAERDHACDRYATDRTLGELGDLSRAQVDVGKKGCEAASAALRATVAAFGEASSVGARSVERAPFEAVVLDWLADPGQTVAPGRALLRLGTVELELRVAVSERDVLRGVGEGTVALVRHGEVPVRTTVGRLSPQAQGASRARQAHLVLAPEQAAGLVPGMSVHVSFVLAEAVDAVAVPRRALRERDGRTQLYVVEGETITEHQVATGPEQDGWVAIEPPLPPGTRVVVGELTTLDPGRPVYAVSEVAL